MILLARYWPHLIAVALLFGSGFWIGRRIGADEVRTLKQHQAETLAGLATAAADAADKARKAEHALAASFASIEANYLREKDDAKDVADGVVADLRAGNLRLRHDLATAACPVPGAAADPAERDAAAERGNEIAGAAVGVGHEADAQLAACQAILQAERGGKP